MQLEFNLPKPLVFDIADPWILYNGRLFQAGKEAENGIDDNYFNLNNTKFHIDEIENARRLEELYFIKYAETLERFQREFLSRAVNTEYTSRRAIEEELRQNKVLSLLINDILPVITNFNLEDRISRIMEEEEGVHSNESFLDVMASHTRRQSTRSSSSGNSRTDIERDVQRQKQQLLETIASQYGRYERATPRRRSSSGRNDIFDQLSMAIESRAPTPDSSGILNDGSILTTHLFPNKNVMFYEGTFYELVSCKEWISYFREYIDERFYRRLQNISNNTNPEEVYDLIKDNFERIDKRYLSRLVNKFHSSTIKINGDFFFPISIRGENGGSVANEIEVLYKKLIEKQVKLYAVEHNEYQSLQMQEIARQREQLSRIANLNKFELNGAGYEKKHGRYYVFVTTPKYALKSPHISDSRKYLPMPPAKIGVAIECDGSYFQIGNPVVMNSYSHPFLPSGSETMKAICLGRYKPSSAKRLPPPQAILELLTKAKENIMMGYRDGSNPYNHLYKSNWRGWITKQEVERRGLICLNDFSQ